MDIDKIMIDYFDGNTSSDEENFMFGTLLNDESQRLDFRSYLLLDKGSKKVVDHFSPPSYVVNTIYSKLGYSIPPSSVKTKPLFSFLKNNSILSHILSAGIVSALTVTVMLLFFNQETNGKIQSANQSNLNQTNVSQPVIPSVISKDITSKPEISRHQNNISVEFDNNRDIMKDDSQVKTDRTNNEILTLSDIEPVSFYQLRNIQSPITIVPDNNYSFFKPFIISYSDPLGLTVGISNTPSWDLTNQTLQPYNVSSFHNMCISLNYDLSPQFRIGAEVRQETFYTEYTGRELNDTLYLYQQQSNLTSFSTSTRFYLFEFGSFNPFFGLNIGVNRGGFITRPNLGVEYQVYPDLSFMFGFEYSWFYFQHLNVWTSAAKVGINYGVMMRF